MQKSTRSICKYLLNSFTTLLPISNNRERTSMGLKYTKNFRFSPHKPAKSSVRIEGEGFPGNFNKRKKWRKKGEISAARQCDASRSIASMENRRCDRRRRGSAGAIEEVVTNKVAGERIRVAESKNDGPPLVVAAVREARQWPRPFPLICETWPPALPFS
jgi:hypothetical protein